MAEQLLQKGVIPLAGRRKSTVTIEAFTGVYFDPGVHEHIAGTAIETDDARFGAGRR